MDKHDTPHCERHPLLAPQPDSVDLNRIQLTGELGGEPLLYDVGDHPVARLALASRRSWTEPGGRLQVATTWFDLTAWEELAEACGRLLHHGDRVYVEGQLHLWSEQRGALSFLCHTIVLDRIELLVAEPAETLRRRMPTTADHHTR